MSNGAHSRIVFLNGVGSAGKSSIARALQAIVAECFLHVAMDAFFAMIPERLIGHEDGFVFETVREDGHPSVIIRSGEAGKRAMRGMRQAIAAMAAQGNNLIVDEVLTGPEREEYVSLLSPFTVYRVGVFAPLDVLEARERQRADRQIGLARWQFSRVHADMHYDLEVDTSSASPEQCAALIKQRFGL